MNQLTFQIQELQDKVNSLTDSSVFHAPETASSSGLSHVPSHHLIVVSLFRVLVECPATIVARSLIHGTVLVHRETFSTIHLHQMNREHLLPEMCMEEVLPLHIANLVPKQIKIGCENGSIEKTYFKTLQYLHRDLPGCFQLGILPLIAEGTYPQNYMVEQPRSQVSEKHVDQFHDLLTFQCWKTSFKTEVRSCSGFPFGSSALDQRSGDGRISGRSEVITINSRTSILEFLRCWMRRLVPP